MKNVKIHKSILSRLLPKTGQVTSYQDYDDGYYEAGWWKGRLNANNRNRFILFDDPPAYEEVVFDRATGLMWPRDYDDVGCNAGISTNWSVAITWARNLTFAAYSDWRIPNIHELASILKPEGSAPYIQTPFVNFLASTDAANYIWASTPQFTDSSRAYTVLFGNGNIKFNMDKTLSRKLMAVRKAL